MVALIMARGVSMVEPDSSTVYERENRGFIEIG
jgi:hypothetical protein